MAVNDKSRFGFILYGLKAKDFKSLDKLIIEGIRAAFRDERIKADIIDKYLQAAGDLIFARTRGVKYVSRMNKACEYAELYGDIMDSEQILQISPSRRMNNDLIKVDKTSDYEHPYELLIKDLEQFSGEGVISCQAVDLMVKLKLGRHTASRRIIAPAEDVGGIPGYEEFLEIIKEPKNKEYKNTLRWAQSQWYREFDMDLVNKRLRYLLR